MRERLFAGDIASEVAEGLYESFRSSLDQGLDDEVKSLNPKIRFSWRAEDAKALDFIRQASDTALDAGFRELLGAIDDFYLTLRVPRMQGGMVQRDINGRVMWELDERGEPLERWEQLTGQDIEEALTRLHRLRIPVSNQVNELMLEAVYARHVASDAYDDTWGAILDGTQGDRSAKSSRESRPDRYHAYFRFYLHSRSKTLLDEINSTIKHLENLRFWQVRSQRG